MCIYIILTIVSIGLVFIFNFIYKIQQSIQYFTNLTKTNITL